MKIVIIQRACADFREGFFDFLSTKEEIILISKSNNLGKIKVPNSLTNKSYFYKSKCISYKDYVLFPFLFFDLLKISPDIVVSEGGKNSINNIAILLYSKIRRKKYFIWDLGKFYLDDSKSFIRKMYSRLYDYIINNSSGILTYNSKGKDYFENIFQDKKITVINNTVDTNRINNIKKNINIHTQKMIESKFQLYEMRLLYVGAINSKKNIEFLIELIQALGQKYCIIILGNGETSYVNKLKKQFYPYNVFFEGFKKMEDAVYYYNITDFSILPGLGGLSINQSLAFNTPVLVNKADGSEFDLVFNGSTGYRYHKLTDLIDFIQYCTRDKRIEMKKNSINLINQNFTIEKMVGLFLEGIK
jgi:glycosyltransferase involved in cell wall biosynthesis